MTAPPANGSPPRHFQFRLATLLIAMVWVGLVSLALRTPTALSSGIFAVLTLLTVLLAVLVAVYRSGRLRAMAIGFLVFGVGYLAYLAVLAGNLSEGLKSGSTPTGEVFYRLFLVVHPDRISVGTDAVGNVIQGFPLPRLYNIQDFSSICHHSLATLLGLCGGQSPNSSTPRANRRRLNDASARRVISSPRPCASVPLCEICSHNLAKRVVI